MAENGKRTAIRAGWVVAFDGRGHRVLRNGTVVLEGDRVLYVGQGFDGRVDETIDAGDRIATGDPDLLMVGTRLDLR